MEGYHPFSLTTSSKLEELIEKKCIISMRYGPEYLSFTNFRAFWSFKTDR
jgi:hypothetical protein